VEPYERGIQNLKPTTEQVETGEEFHTGDTLIHFRERGVDRRHRLISREMVDGVERRRTRRQTLNTTSVFVSLRVCSKLRSKIREIGSKS